MLLQTNSYIVPKDKRSEHSRLLRKFRQTLNRLGCESFEVYEQVGANWAMGESTGRFVQIIRFRDRQHQQQVQVAEKQDPAAQQLIADFCALINFPYQQQQGLFAVGFYGSALPVAPARTSPRASTPSPIEPSKTDASEAASGLAPEPQAASEEENPTLLNFANLAPVDESAPMRITPESDSPNGEHAASDAPEAMLDLVQNAEADPELLSAEDREAILGELTGEDADASQDDADKTSRNR